MSSPEASANPLYWEVVVIAPECELTSKAFRWMKGYYVADRQHLRPFKALKHQHVINTRLTH